MYFNKRMYMYGDARQDLFGNYSHSDLMMKIEFYCFPIEAVLETSQSFADALFLSAATTLLQNPYM